MGLFKPLAVRRALLAGCSAVALLISCDRQPTAPDGSARPQVARGVSFRPVFSRASQVASANGIVAFVKVRVRIVRGDGIVAVDTVISFPADAESVPLALNVPLSASAPTSGESMSLTLEYIDDTGAIVFTGGPVAVNVAPTVVGSPAPPPVDVPVVYTGPGATATRVVISPKVLTAFGGDPIAFSAQALDAAGAVVAGTPIVFAAVDPWLVTLSANGTGTALTKRGSTTVTAQLLTGPTDNATLSVLLKASTLAAVSGSGQSGAAGATLAQPVRVRATASDGVAVAGVAVTFVAANGGSVGTASAITDGNGDAQTTWQLGASVGTQTLTASAQGLSGSPVGFTATATAGSATLLAVTTQPASSSVSGANIGPVAVTARDALGNVVAGFAGAVTVALAGGAGNATLTGTKTVNAVAGVATFASLSVDRAGTGYTLIASSGTLASATSAAFSITSGPAAQLVFTGQPSDAAAGASIGGPIAVTARDAAGNVAAFNGTVTLALAPNSNGGTLSGVTSVAAVNGVATFTNVSVDRTGIYQLNASASGLTTAQSPTFNIAAGAPSSLTLVSGGGQTAAAGSALAPVIVAVADAFGNAVPGFTVTFTPAAGSGSAVPASVATNALGRATTTWTLGATAGAQSLTASGTGLTSLVIGATATAGGSPATQLAFSVQPSTTVAGSAITPSVVVRALDANGALVTSFTSNVSLAIGANPGGGALSGTVSVAAVGGVATFSGLSINLAGVGYTLVATSGTLTAATSSAFDIVAGSGSVLSLVSGGGQTAGAGTTLSPIVVKVTDALSNPVAGVTLSLTPSAGSTSAPTALTNSSGLATITWTLGPTPGTQTLTVSGTGLASLTVSATATAVGATHLAFTTQPTTTTAGAAITPSVTVAALDANNAVDATFSGNVSLAIGTNPASGALSGTVTVAAVNGVATFAGITINQSGIGYTLVASSGSLTAATSSAFNIATGGIAGLSFQVQPSNAVTHVAMVPAVQVRAVDGFGNTVTSFTGTIDLALATNPSSGVLLGTTSVAAVAGVATFSNVSVDAPGAGYTLQASSGSLLTTSAAFAISAGAPTHLAFVANPPTTAAGAVITPAVDVAVLDAFGYTVTSFTGNVTIAIGTNPAAGTLSGTLTVAAVAGVASFPNLSIDNQGTGYTLTATSGSLTSATSGPFDIGGVSNSWTNAAGGSWSTATNWSLGHVPTASENVLITLPGTYTVTMNVNHTGLSITVGGSSGTQTLSMFSRSLALTGGLTVGAQGVVAATTSSLTGTGAVLNNGQITLDGSTLAMSILNQGVLSVSASTTISGALTTSSTSVIRVGQINGSAGTASLTVSNSFTNNGTIDLTTVSASAFNAQISLLAGTLTNGPTGTINALAGAAAGGTRNLLTAVDNQGTINVGTALGLNKTSAVDLNSGAINITGGTLSITQSGGSPSFTNTGAISIGAGQSLIVSNGAFNQNAGTSSSLGGAGSLALINVAAAFNTAFTPATFLANTSTVSLTSNLSTATMAITLTSTILSGPVTLTNAAGQTLSIDNSTIGFPFDNQGTVFTSGVTAFNGAFTTGTGSVVHIGQVNGNFGTAALTVANGFTNNGTIDLTTITPSAFNAQLSVTSGVLTNAPGATISAVPGSAGGGSRSLFAALANQGTVTVSSALTINKAGAAHTNSGAGVINISGGDLTVTQSGGSFTNSAAIAISAGRTLTVSGGTFTQDPGTSSALGGAGALVLSNVAATFNTPFTPASLTATNTNLTLTSNVSTATMAMSFAQTIVSGAVTITNAASQSMTLDGTVVNTALANLGTLAASGGNTINGTLTTGAGSTLNIGQINGNVGTASFTVANGFTNNGIINLTTVIASAFNAQLVVTAGTLTNASGATINSTPGAAAGGTRNLLAALDNQGTVNVTAALTINKASAAHTNSGTANINVSGGDLTVLQSGTAPSFTNTATITVSAGRTLTFNSGSFAHSAGTSSSLTGAGTIALTGTTATFAASTSIGALVGSAAATVNVTGTWTATSTGGVLTLNNTTFTTTAGLTNSAGATLTLDNSTLNGPFTNNGLLLASGPSAINGALTTASGSTIRVAQINGNFGTANLTVANAFTNNGTIDLTTSVASAFNATLTVTSGSLTNAALSTINVLPGSLGGGTRTLAAQLSNIGTINVSTPLSINKASAASVNGGIGVINITGGDVTVTQTGTTPSFTSSGTITVSAGRNLIVNGGTFTLNSGTSFTGAGGLSITNVTANFNAAFAPASFTASGSTVTLTSSLNTSTMALSFTGTTVSGSTITNAAGQTLTLDNSTINSTFANSGTLAASGPSTLGGTVTTASGSTIRVGQINGNFGTAALTVANSFTNNGTIDLTTVTASAFNASLTVTTGVLTNAGTINSLPGALAGGTRTLTAALANQGTLTVSTPLTINKASAAHTNSGVASINLSGGNLTVTQAGTSPSFTNTASINISSGFTLAVSSGSFAHNPGTSAALTGAGTLALAGVTASFTSAVNVGAIVETSSTTLNVSGTMTTGATNVLSLTNSTFTSAGLTNGSGVTLLLDNSAINGPMTNNGTVTVSGNSSFGGALTTGTGSAIRIGQINGTFGTASLTVANAFINNGTIDLTTAVASAFNAQLTVTNGVFTNGASGSINALPGLLAGGTRTLSVPVLNNLGTITAATGMTIPNAGAADSNSGTINVTGGNLTVSQTGAGPSFTNAGAISISGGRALTVTGGTFVYNVGTIGGAGTLTLTNVASLIGTAMSPATFTASSGSISLSNAFSTAGMTTQLTGLTVSGGGSLTNAAGQTLTIDATAINVPVSNLGTLIASSSSSIGAALTTGVGSLLRVTQISNVNTAGLLTVTGGFTNNGAIELTTGSNSATAATLTLTGTSTLTNSSSGTITSLAGTTGGGQRVISATTTINQGTITVDPALAGTMTIGGVLQTTGSVNMEIGGLTAITQYDRLQVTGSSNPAGTLNVTLINGFIPAVGNSFTIMTRGSGTGAFTTVNLPTLPAGSWVVSQTGTTIVLTVQ